MVYSYQLVSRNSPRQRYDYKFYPHNGTVFLLSDDGKLSDDTLSHDDIYLY